MTSSKFPELEVAERPVGFDLLSFVGEISLVVFETDLIR
jgi:hypothetical protein